MVHILKYIGIVRLGLSCVVSLFVIWLVGEYLINLFSKKELSNHPFLRDTETDDSWAKETKRLMERYRELERYEYKYFVMAISFSILGLGLWVIFHIYFPDSMLSSIVLLSVTLVWGVWILLRGLKVAMEDLLTKVSKYKVRPEKFKPGRDLRN